MTRLIEVELHCHTTYSKDCLTGIQDLVEMARKAGLQRLAVTDHNTIEGALKAREADPELVIVGEEILTSKGELLAFFVKEEIPKKLDPLEAIARLREQGAFISVSHPFDRRRHGWHKPDLEQIAPLVDAIEIFNSRCQVGLLNERAAAFARTSNLAGTVGSDAHTLREIGRSRMILPEFSSAQELRELIRGAKIKTQLSSPWIHLTSTYARMIKRIGIRRERENSPN